MGNGNGYIMVKPWNNSDMSIHRLVQRQGGTLLKKYDQGMNKHSVCREALECLTSDLSYIISTINDDRHFKWIEDTMDDSLPYLLGYLRKHLSRLNHNGHGYEHLGEIEKTKETIKKIDSILSQKNAYHLMADYV